MMYRATLIEQEVTPLGKQLLQYPISQLCIASRNTTLKKLRVIILFAPL